MSVTVRGQARAGGWTFEVTVADGGGRTTHTVELEERYVKRLGWEGRDPGDLVRRSFDFLLRHEPKESILSRFELPAIGRYFPAYEGEMRKAAGA